MIDIIRNIFSDSTNETTKVEEDNADENLNRKKVTFFNSFKDSILFIDSNIFMDKRFGILFEFLEDIDINIIVLKEQYQELYNIKKNTTYRNSKKGKSVRNAFRIIDHFQEMNKLTIKGLDIESDLSIHVDPVLIKEIINLVTESKKVIFFTEDFDLKIRLREQLNQKNINKNLLIVYSYKDIEFLHQIKGEIQCPNCKQYMVPYIEVEEYPKEEEPILSYDFSDDYGARIIKVTIQLCSKCHHEISRSSTSYYDPDYYRHQEY